MKLIDTENIIRRVYDLKYDIRSSILKTPLYSYYHQGTEFTYLIIDDIHRITLQSLPIYEILEMPEVLKYIIDGVVVTHPLYIEEDAHFQLSTIKPTIGYDLVLCVQEIYEVMTN